MPNGPLSLPARLCLLAWDLDPTRAAPVVRAGALADLARRGLLVDDDGIATPRDLDSRTGDPALDGLLELVSESFPHGWRTWVTLHARHTLDAVREHLVAEGVLRAEKHRVLGVFPSVDHVLADTARADALRAEAHRVLSGAASPADVSDTTATALALAAAADLPHTAAGTPPPGRGDPGFAAILHELETALRDAAPAPSLPKGR
ncbi:GOLPH3/VPS74 family protein [Streptomyces albogriseolus]|uniref:GOLPH3/VPS74 family protein n=1 Tax=Streptomyces albogriseolus TaxID=1887 RepID=UPI0036CDC743